MSLFTDVRHSYVRVMLQTDDRIGIGGTIPDPLSRTVRDIVFLEMLISGSINVPLNDLSAALTATIDETLSKMELA